MKSVNFVILFVLTIISAIVIKTQSQQLYYYDCQQAGFIVKDIVTAKLKEDPRIAASLLRLHFSDCFAGGCDGSVLLDDTKTVKGEKSAMTNQNSLRGFEVIDSIKAALEKACPQVVSCTDILALAARDAIYLVGGPYWDVFLGNRDGVKPHFDEANNLPSPFDPLETLLSKFSAKGLSKQDMVVLSGAHTLGFARCMYRTTTSVACPNNNTLIPMDSTPYKFDNLYYSNLEKNLGVLKSDQVLMKDDQTAAMVNNYGRNPGLFLKDFAESMVKMANIGVLRGKNVGQIRKSCRLVN